MDNPPKPGHLPEWASDELPLLTETVGDSPIPLLSEPLPEEPTLRESMHREPTLREPTLYDVVDDVPPHAGRPSLGPASAHRLRPAGADALRGEQRGQIEEELRNAAQLIMQEVIDDYMLQIEAELHRRLEEHLDGILRAGRR